MEAKSSGSRQIVAQTRGIQEVPGSVNTTDLLNLLLSESTKVMQARGKKKQRGDFDVLTKTLEPQNSGLPEPLSRDDSSHETRRRKSVRRSTRAKPQQRKVERKWWWPKKPFPPDPERERLISTILKIYQANEFTKLGMPLEFHSTEALRVHLKRLQAGEIPYMTKKGVLNVDD